MTGFEDYRAKVWSGVKQGGGDVLRAALTETQNSYQEVLTGHASVSPTDGHTGEFTNVESPPPEAPMNDQQLAELIEEQHDLWDNYGPEMTP